MSRQPDEGFDGAAAVTRSLLGWGVVAGPFYLVVGFILAVTRPGFDLGRHALSLLLLGEFGWMQAVNLVLSALMVLAAAFGILRAVRNGRGLAMGVLVGVFGASLVFSAIFPPDPVAGFPPGSTGGEGTASGILHLVFGAIGFLCLASAAFAYAGWAASRGERGGMAIGIVCGILIVVGFLGGAALATSPVGIGMLWLAVIAGWAWLALASAHLYTVVPHPLLARRVAAA